MTARPGRAAVVSVIAVTTSGVLPVFLTGALSVQMRGDLHFGASGLGLAAGVAFLASAVASTPFGRVSERMGSRAAMRTAAVTSAAALAGIAAVAHSFAALLAWLVVGGAANGLAQPSSNAMVVERVGPARQGTAFAIKQAAIPTSTLLGGLAVPLVALTVGWRWAFAGAAAGALAAAATVPGPRTSRVEPPSGVARPTVLPLLLLAAGAALGGAAGGTLGSFVTSSGVAFGLSAGAAGLVQAMGSAVSLAVRLGAGLIGDRRRMSHVHAITGVAAMMAAGAVGFGLMSFGRAGPYVAGACIAYGGAWAWPGLFNFAVTRRYPHFPAAATGITQTGVYMGGAVGPLLFGILAQRTSYATAWISAAGVAVAAAVVLASGRAGGETFSVGRTR